MYNILFLMVLVLINILLPINVSFVFIISHYIQYTCYVDVIAVVTMMRRLMRR